MSIAPRIAIVDDHPLLASGLGAQLEYSGAETLLVDPMVGLEGVLAAVIAYGPDCAVVDLGLPFPGGGQSLIAALATSDVRFMVLTGESERWRWALAAHAGASAILSKADELAGIVEAILRVAAGEAVKPAELAQLAAEHERVGAERARQDAIFQMLSGREREILAGLMTGRNVQQLAESHFVSVQTVRSQVKSLLRKLGCSSQLEAVALAHAAGFAPSNNLEPSQAEYS